VKELKDEFREGQNQYHATKKTGTPRYMAPEVFSEAGLYGLPADVYSFVLILWEVMSLRLPFNGLSADEHSVSTYVKKLRPKINKSWPNAMKRLIKDGWHHNPSRRPNMPTVFFEIASYLESNRVQHERYLSRTLNLSDEIRTTCSTCT